jgi:hypothetical protein
MSTLRTKGGEVQIPLAEGDNQRKGRCDASAFSLCCTANLDATLKKSIKTRGGYWMWFYVHPK